MPKRRYTTNELLERKFGHVTLKQEVREDKRIYWVCECECGKLIKREERYILVAKNLSCGCKHASKLKQASSFKQWTGYEELNGQYFAKLRCGAKKRNIPFDITIEQAWEQFLKQERKCALTKLELTFARARAKNAGVAIQTASLDRINSNKGYTVDNIQWLHKDVNRMKNGFTQEYFLSMCELIVSKGLPQR